ncbi:MAG: SDR family oxidoreductase [Bacteroidales bacterium]|nr:SDR family oxidoreductase [Bacteroidales bacterium]
MKAFVLITGASEGIGLELAKVFAAHGHNLLLVARRGTLLKKTATSLQKQFKVDAKTFICDLSLQKNIEGLMEYINTNSLNIEILINNAGAGDFSLFSESVPQRNNQLIDLNIKAVVHLTHRIIPLMIKAGKGRILNVASVAAFAPNPFIAVYAASKSFILNFSHAIGAELKGQNVQVSVLCPGDTKTGFQRNAGLGKFDVHEALTAGELANYTYAKFITEGETEIIPPQNRQVIDMIRKTSNLVLLSANFFKMRQKLAAKLSTNK